MVDVEGRPKTAEEIRAGIDEAKRKRDAENLRKGTKERRAAEIRQRKGRVNNARLRGRAPVRDGTWTFRARSDLVKRVKQLATELSQPGDKVSIAELMEEGIELLLANYAEIRNEDT